MTAMARSDKSWFAEWWRTVDHGIIAGVAALFCIGMLLSLAAGPVAAADHGYTTFHYVQRHAIFVLAAAYVI